MKTFIIFKTFLTITLFCAFVQAQNGELDKNYLSWSEKQTAQIGETWRVKGRIGGFFDNRISSTDKAYNYKLRATLMSPELIRAAARREQIRNRLTEDETRKLVAEAENEQSLVVLIEVDPREGSGIIPNDWRVMMQTKGANAESNKTIRGLKKQSLGDIIALKSVFTRDYDYDIFWVAFPLKDEKGIAVWSSVPSELEIIVGIYNKEGRVNWKISDALKSRIKNLLEN